MLTDYIHLTKPRIIVSNLIASFGGFWLASRWEIQWGVMIAVLIGSALVMACSTVMNNYLDRDLDIKMKRTENRPLPAGRLKPSHVFLYAFVLGLAGTVVLWLGTNVLTALLGLLGIFVYVVIYTIWLKRHSTWSTSIGGISGAMPPVMGYTAVSNELDLGAWLLFAILFLWQPPHFWSLGIRKREEYRAAGFPLLPVVKGVLRTKIQMIPYVVLLLPTSLLLYVYDYAGRVYAGTALVLGLYWLILCIQGFFAKDDNLWAKQNFKVSIYYLMITFLVMVVDTAR